MSTGGLVNRIRKVETADDVESLVSVVNQAFLTVADEFGFSASNAPTFPAFIEKSVIEKQRERGLKLYGYWADGVLIGCIGTRDTGEGVFLIERLAVLPEYRHRNIGSRLMEFALDKIAQEHGKTAVVEIVDSNEQLKSWYQKQGFVERRIDHYAHLPFEVSVLDMTLE